MLTTLVISCCLVFIFLQLTNPYISLAKNAIKHTTTETYLISYRLANIHNIIKTISLAAYANAKYGLLLKVRYTARKLVVTDIVLGMMLAVLKHFKIKQNRNVTTNVTIHIQTFSLFPMLLTLTSASNSDFSFSTTSQ